MPIPSSSAGRRGLLALVAALLLTQACLFSDAESSQKGVVRSETADVYSSTALVALKVATVKKGDRVEILREESVTGPTYTERWLNVRLNGQEDTTGWIEERHVVSESVVTESVKIAGKPDETPAIARGRVKVNQRLRLAPGRDGDVATELKRGTEFEIIGKKQTTYRPEAKPKPKIGADNRDEEQAEELDTALDEPEEKTEMWYQVRLGQDSIIKGGWILAQTVNLEVPDEILHLEGEGRRFVAWQTVGTVRDDRQGEKNNYVTFMRRGNAPDDVDFERIYFIFYDPNTRNYYAPYVDSDLRGVFPVAQRDDANRRIVTAHVLNGQNEPAPVEFEILRSDKGKWLVRRITAPIPGERISRRR
jgi:uncharacterized protein YgiM (DUF1202 family)